MWGHPEPEKMADTAIKAREKALAIAKARPAIKMLTEAPKPKETAVPPPKMKRGVLAQGLRCQAKTLEGKQCGFKATCGNFCKKHAM